MREDLFYFPWPGPGNSEGPVDPDPWVEAGAEGKELERRGEWEHALLVTSSWPGPGDSEA